MTKGKKAMPTHHPKEDAAQFSDAELRASLQECEDCRYYLDAVSGPPTLGIWDAHAGPMLFFCDDAAFLHAQIEFMKHNGYPIFHTDAEIHEYAAAHGWPLRRRDSLDKKD